MAVLLIVGFTLAWSLFPNKRYFFSLAILMGCALLYNLPPIRLKDKAFLDVISESINNPLRLWLGWFAVASSRRAGRSADLDRLWPGGSSAPFS